MIREETTICIMSEGLSPHGYFINFEFFHLASEHASYFKGSQCEI